ncbi:hypothetical protein DL96DRAFT_540761 [Flagelloscypha sp. PMI_526]|nr:hypothetical protein DL96DRAFT_540761 [Flagelloscypha sp. PMI_526]
MDVGRLEIHPEAFIYVETPLRLFFTLPATMRPTTLFTLIFLAASSVTAAPGCGTSNDESSSIWSRVLDNVAGFSDESGLFQSALRFFSPGKKEENLVGKVYHIQFHATCKDSAKEIIEKIEKKQFKLREGRDWPDEFSWKGGLYLTSELEHAQAYARAFLPGRCKDLGGMVVIGKSIILPVLHFPFLWLPFKSSFSIRMSKMTESWKHQKRMSLLRGQQ